MKSTQDLYTALPAIDRLLQQQELLQLAARVGMAGVKSAAQLQLRNLREKISDGDSQIAARLSSPDFLRELVSDISATVERQFTSTLVPVFNLTGTVIHTNLGRARLPSEAIAAIKLAAAESNNLEFDLASGRRGDRDDHIEAALCDICGAEAATVVNNNAAAVLLVLNTFAQGKEVVISRGELVEIGGSFRIPDVMKSANCYLKEIGTTNRTHLKDFAAAIDSGTGLIMKVHASNYEIKGFTKAVPEQELSSLAREHSIPFVSDLGSGTLVDLTRYGLPDEPTVAGELARGADLVTFSGDKLLGGPQAGVIVGKKMLMEQLKNNPLKRALRVDKVTLAGLLEVVNLYRDPHRLAQRLPVLCDLTRPVAEIAALAESIGHSVQKALAGIAEVTTEPCKSQIGSGSMPAELLESRAIVCTPVAEKGERDATLVRLASAFRALPKPVVGRIHDGSLFLDLRCLWDEESFTEQLQGLSLQNPSQNPSQNP